MRGAPVLLILGALMVVAGATVLAWPFGLMVAGALVLLAAVDLRR